MERKSRIWRGKSYQISRLQYDRLHWAEAQLQLRYIRLHEISLVLVRWNRYYIYSECSRSCEVFVDSSTAEIFLYEFHTYLKCHYGKISTIRELGLKPCLIAWIETSFWIVWARAEFLSRPVGWTSLEALVIQTTEISLQKRQRHTTFWEA